MWSQQSQLSASLYRHCDCNGVEFGGKGRLRAAISKRVHEMRVRVITVTAPKARGSNSVNFNPTPTNALAESNRLKSQFTEPCLDRFESQLMSWMKHLLAAPIIFITHLHLQPPSASRQRLVDSALALSIGHSIASPPHRILAPFHLSTLSDHHQRHRSAWSTQHRISLLKTCRTAHLSKASRHPEHNTVSVSLLA